MQEGLKEVLAESVDARKGENEGDTVTLLESQALRTPEGVEESRGERVLLPGSGAVTPGLGVSAAVMLMLRDVRADMVRLWVAVGEVEEEAQELALGVNCGEVDSAGDSERVPLVDTVALQGGGASKPVWEHCEQPVQGMGEVRLAVGQKLPVGQVRQVALEEAPVLSLKVPAGQGVAMTEERGQKKPAGQRMGAPEEQ